MKKNKLKLIILAIGVIFLAITVKLISNSANYLNNSIRTEATITDYRIDIEEKREKGRTKKTTFYYPKFQFKDQQNNIIQSESNVGQGNSRAYAVGSQVEVLYMANNHQEVIINSFSNLWMSSIILGIFTIVFLAIGFYIPKIQ